MRLISEDSLFYLRAAAAEWLRSNDDSPNAPNVSRALIDTNQTTTFPGDPQ